MELSKSEIIIIPDEGYSTSIYKKGIKLYRKLYCPIIISGANRNPEKQGSYGLKKYLETTVTPIPVDEQISKMMTNVISKSHIVYEDKSNNTKENAINSLNIIKNKFPETNHIHLVGSLEGIVRRHLTFKKTIDDFNLGIDISLHPVYGILQPRLMLYRFLLIPSEIYRIYLYRKKGDL